MQAGIDFPSPFGTDLFETRRGNKEAHGNPYDPESLLSEQEALVGMTYDNSHRDWPSEFLYRLAVQGRVPIDAILRIAPRIPDAADLMILF